MPTKGSILSLPQFPVSSVSPSGSNIASSCPSGPLPSPRETMHAPSSYQGNGTNTLGCLGTKVDGLDNTLKQFQERVKVFQKIISAMDSELKTLRSSFNEERTARITLEKKLRQDIQPIIPKEIVKGKMKGKGRAEDKDPHHGDFLAITSAAFYKMMGCKGTKDLPDLLPNGDYWIDRDGDEYLRPNWKKDWKGANDAWEFPRINYVRTNGPILAKRPGFDMSASCFSNADIGKRVKALFVAAKAKYMLSDSKHDAIAQTGRQNIRKTRVCISLSPFTPDPPDFLM
ncbi:hypothetical protein BS47DRAFT_1395289 [Hydnum rufescens UP504]|uniref:Uncharacterized protein n=1 Tax=Hydnum rufescens UP504 TaxID=1448309 RepID=A0A9P6ASW9_9AGAM|nr:hypothetical protein BS47DRAFT_1395289 [Hydnum rufescens UP504]